MSNDYMIKRVSLEDIIHTAILNNKQLLIQNQFSIEVHTVDSFVYTDTKALVFILESKIMEPGSEKATLVVFLKKGSLEVTVINERLPPGLAFIYVNSFVKSWGLKSRFVLP